MIPFNHSRQELLHSPKMRNSINLKNLPLNLLLPTQNSHPIPNTRIIDQHRRVPVALPDLCCYGCELGGGGYVALVEVDSWS